MSKLEGRKGTTAHDFYPFVQNGADGQDGGQGTISSPITSTHGAEADHAEGRDEPQRAHELVVRYPARIAVYDDAAAAPRVVVVEAQDVRSYLEEITVTVSRLAKEQGGSIPFMVIREVVENFIHAYFIQPTISILDGGETIRFSDQGPGIRSKELALEYGTTSATEEMKQYIRGVGSGLPYVQQYMEDRGGSLTIEDNIAGGAVVTISNVQKAETQPAGTGTPSAWIAAGGAGAGLQWPATPGQWPPYQQVPYQQTTYQQPAYQQPVYPQAPYQQAPYQQQPWPSAAAPMGAPQQAGGPVPTAAPLELSERDRTVLSHLLAYPSVGPTDLTRAYGSSQPTWSRELQKLERSGFLRKGSGSQKYVLTDAGRAIAQRL